MVDHRVVAVAFTLAVSADLTDTIHNLTIAQLQGSYDGAILNWQQLGGPNVLIGDAEVPSACLSATYGVDIVKRV